MAIRIVYGYRILRVTGISITLTEKWQRLQICMNLCSEERKIRGYGGSKCTYRASSVVWSFEALDAELRVR